MPAPPFRHVPTSHSRRALCLFSFEAEEREALLRSEVLALQAALEEALRHHAQLAGDASRIPPDPSTAAGLHTGPSHQLLPL